LTILCFTLYRFSCFRFFDPSHQAINKPSSEDPSLGAMCLLPFPNNVKELQSDPRCETRSASWR